MRRPLSPSVPSTGCYQVQTCTFINYSFPVTFGSLQLSSRLICDAHTCLHSLQVTDRQIRCSAWYEGVTFLHRWVTFIFIFTPGSIFMFDAVATLIGTPTAGAFIRTTTEHNFDNLIIFCGVMVTSGGLCLGVAHFITLRECRSR